MVSSTSTSASTVSTLLNLSSTADNNLIAAFTSSTAVNTSSFTSTTMSSSTAAASRAPPPSLLASPPSRAPPSMGIRSLTSFSVSSMRYAILCGGDKLFLDIDKQNQIIAKKLDEADVSLNYFNLRCTENAGEFVIMDYMNFEREQKIIESNPIPLLCDLWPTPRYLKVNTHLGFNFGPLYMVDSVNERQCRLKVRPRLFHEYSHVNMNDFTNGKDKFYICTSRRHGITGYLYVKDNDTPDIPPGNNSPDNPPDNPPGDIPSGNPHRNRRGNRPRYTLACKPFIGGGSSDGNMFFRLVRYESMYAQNYAATSH
ncbi:hypothetical protein EMCRGX_G006906 [Ephydatia muelleri]